MNIRMAAAGRRMVLETSEGQARFCSLFIQDCWKSFTEAWQRSIGANRTSQYVNPGSPGVTLNTTASYTRRLRQTRNYERQLTIASRVSCASRMEWRQATFLCFRALITGY